MRLRSYSSDLIVVSLVLSVQRPWFSRGAFGMGPRRRLQPRVGRRVRHHVLHWTLANLHDVYDEGERRITGSPSHFPAPCCRKDQAGRFESRGSSPWGLERAVAVPLRPGDGPRWLAGPRPRATTPTSFEGNHRSRRILSLLVEILRCLRTAEQSRVRDHRGELATIFPPAVSTHSAWWNRRPPAPSLRRSLEKATATRKPVSVSIARQGLPVGIAIATVAWLPPQRDTQCHLSRACAPSSAQRCE
jgi:hypothetical protein